MWISGHYMWPKLRDFMKHYEIFDRFNNVFIYLWGNPWLCWWRCRYNAVNFLKITSNRHATARPRGRMWVVLCEFEVDQWPAAVIAILCTTSWSIRPRYKGTDCITYCMGSKIQAAHASLQWRHNEHDGVSNQRVTIVNSTVCSSADQWKHQISASLGLVRGICVSIWWRHHAVE